MGKLIPLVCPNCGAELNVDQDLEIFYCQHCGTKLMMPVERHEHTININRRERRERIDRYVDEAEVERQKTARFSFAICMLMFVILMIFIQLVF